MSAITAVYVSNADSQEISVFALDLVTGALEPVEVAKAGGAVMPLAVSPDRRTLFAALRTEPFRVASFAIDPASGRLSALSAVPIAASMPSIATDRTGRFLFACSYQSSLIATYPIGPTGFVQAEAVQVVPTRPKAHAIRVDSANRFVYVPCLGGDLIEIYRFDPVTGWLEPAVPASVHVKPGAGPRHFAFHPNNRFFYLLNELDGSLNAYARDPRTGALAEMQSLSTVPAGFAGKPSAADLHVTPDGTLIYASVRGSSTLAGFRIEPASGKLTALGSTETETEPRGFAIDPRGRFLLAAGQKSDHLTVYRIEAETGRLETVKRHKLGKAPNWVEIVPLP
jgi:6-phosphogluconolactonase